MMSCRGLDLSVMYRRSVFTICFAGGLVLLLTILYRTEHVRYVAMPMVESRPTTPLSSPTTTTPLSMERYVLLLTYGRSGSTFTSALISQHPEVFFSFEPLFVLQDKFSLTPQIYSDSARNDSIAIIKSFFTCKFRQELLYSLENFQHRNSDNTKDFYKCLMEKKTGAYHLSCYLKFLEDCENHKIRFIKTIRMRMAWTQELLDLYPNLKILYLIRDPRATLYSQARVFGSFKWTTQGQNVSKDHCQIIQRDLDAVERLTSQYPGRIMGLRYENGATNPFNYTQRIYQFLNLKYDQDVASFVEKITHSHKQPKTRDSYGIVKDNATKAMNNWRHSAGYNTVHRVDSVCSYVYPKLGYVPVRSQAHLESDESLVSEPAKWSIFD